MAAVLTVALGLLAGLIGILLLFRRGWLALPGLALVICGPLAAFLTLPQAWVMLRGQPVLAVVTALDERAVARQRRGWWGESRRYDVQLCYRFAAPPAFGVNAPAIELLEPDPTSRRCASLPGDQPPRLVRLRYDEESYDRLALDMPALVQVAIPGGLVELAYPVDAPVLPWLPRPWGKSASGMTATAQAQVLEITVQRRGPSTGGGQGGQELSVPVAHVRLRYTPPGRDQPVELVDAIDADGAASLAVGDAVMVRFDPAQPRAAQILGATRRHAASLWLDYALGGGLVLIVVATFLLLARRRLARKASSRMAASSTSSGGGADRVR